MVYKISISEGYIFQTSHSHLPDNFQSTRKHLSYIFCSFRGSKHPGTFFYFPPYKSQKNTNNTTGYPDWYGLFLNVLNDLPIQNLCFAEDSLQLPPMVAKLDDKPIYHGMFNQFKQEYIFARYQYYSSLEFGDEAHFADRKTHLTNLFDYPLYSIRIESLKSAYKTLYSLLDKIAFFLNYYFELGLLDRLISFHNVWDRNKTKNNSLEYAQNYGLSALYWISRDLYKEQSQSAHPHAKRLSDIRNALEHRYVKVCWPFATELSEKRRDSSAFYISEDELRIQSMELLGIVREALISLTIAVFIEEKKRKAKRGDNEKIVPLHLHSYDDEWKI